MVEPKYRSAMQQDLLRSEAAGTGSQLLRIFAGGLLSVIALTTIGFSVAGVSSYVRDRSQDRRIEAQRYVVASQGEKMVDQGERLHSLEDVVDNLSGRMDRVERGAPAGLEQHAAPVQQYVPQVQSVRYDGDQVIRPATQEMPSLKLSDMKVQDWSRFVQGWSYAWQHEMIDAYISHYSPSAMVHVPTRNEWMSRDELAAYKRQLNDRDDWRSVVLGDWDVRTFYQDEGGRVVERAVIIVEQKYSSSSYADEGTKRLVVEMGQQGRPLIIVEDFHDRLFAEMRALLRRGLDDAR
ncbi:MAG: hypothetical protein ABIH41_01610 [Nanoarchaeota archaeon]